MRRRLFLGAVLVGIVTLVVGVLVIVGVQRQVRDNAQRELFRQAEATAAIVAEELEGVTLTVSDIPGRQLQTLRQRVGRILDRARAVGGHDAVEGALAVRGRVIALSPGADLLEQIPTDIEAREVVSVSIDGTPMLATVRRVSIDAGDVIIAIARIEPLLPVQALSRSLLVALGAGTILLIALGAWFSRVTVKRLAALERASRAVAAGDLEARAPADGNDEITRVSVAFNDMTQQLKGARRRERDFLMSVGHDLRTPLTTIRGYAEGLDAGEIEAADLARVGSVLRTQTDRLSRLVEDLTLLARLEAREFSLRTEPVDLAAHLKEIVEGYRTRADDAYVRLEFEAEPIGVLDVDPDRVAQICGNLLDNALRYTPDGGVVRVEVLGEDGRAAIRVTDSGPGIDAEDLDHVYERLYVAQRYRPVRPEGSGLGLSIVKELADAMGAEVTVTSELGVGTTVVVVL